MKRWIFGAICAAIGCAPAHATTWFLQFSADTTGTFTRYCLQSIPECMVPTITPISGTVDGFFQVEAFTGAKSITGMMTGDFGGYLAAYSFTLNFDGMSISGSNFSYREGGTGNSPNFWWETTAPVVRVSAIPNLPGPVPEPETWTMLILGFGLLGAAMRQRQVCTRRSTNSQ